MGRLARATSFSSQNERGGGLSPDTTLPPVSEVPPLRSGKPRTASITSMNSYRASPFFDSSYFDRPRHSPAYADEPASRFARSPTESSDNIRKENIQRKPSVIGQPSLPEIWKPTVTPDQDAKLSRAFSLARRNSNASATSALTGSVSSSQGAPLSNPLTDEPQPMSNHSDRERAGIRSAEQEWHNLDRARDKDKQSHILSDARSVYGAHHRSEERLGLHQPSSNISNSSSQANSTLYSHPLSNNSRIHIPPPSASRPIHNKKSISSFDDGVFSLSGSPGSKGWGSVSRSPHDYRYDGFSRSPQTPDEVSHSRYPASLRSRYSTQDIRHVSHQQEGLSYGRAISPHYEEDLEEPVEEVARSYRSYHENTVHHFNEVESRLRLREEALTKREADLNKREEELKREEESKREEETRRRQHEKEEETRREQEAKQRQEEELRKAALAKRQEEEDTKRKQRETTLKERKEREARAKEQEIKQKEEKAKLKEEEARRKAEEAKRMEEEAKRREGEAKRREGEARRKEEEAKMKEEEARRREEEAWQKEKMARLKEEVARKKEEETRQKEIELGRREEELRRREEDLIRREIDARRKDDDKQKVQQEEFRRREEEIRRQRTEGKRQDSWPGWSEFPHSFPQASSSSGPWPIPKANDRAPPAASPPNGGTTPSRSSASGWTSASATTRPTSTTGSQSSSVPKATTGTSSTTRPAGNPPLTEAEFQQRQAEQARQREEQFKREQARAQQEFERFKGKEMTWEDTTKIFETHRRQWEMIHTQLTQYQSQPQSGPSRGGLIWQDFPWPMFKSPKSPEDLTASAIRSYMQSPHHPQDKSQRDRIKELIRKWHPDRFNNLLPLISVNDLEMISEGAGSVVRALNDFLRSSD